MKVRERREIEAFGLSFLDVISCGFGAVVLLLVLAKIGEPTVIEESAVALRSQVQDLERRLHEIRGETYELNRELVTKQEQLSKERIRLARLQRDLSTVQGQFDTTQQNAEVASIIAERLARAQQQISEEERRLLGRDFRRSPEDQTIGGIPVDSEYIIFVIDTSGSMFNYAWGLMLGKVEETLEIYPEVKGIQVMNDQGEYMFSRYRGQWIPDTAVRRRAIIDTLRTWNVFSNSSPVEGITEAIRAFYEPDKKISVYVFGDEFTGGSVDAVVKAVDAINREDADGRRMVRIHAVGFPTQFLGARNFQQTGIRFATLMHILCYRNDGTFVGLDRTTFGGYRMQPLAPAPAAESPPLAMLRPEAP